MDFFAKRDVYEPCGLFSLEHFIALFVLIGLIILGLFLSRKQDEKGVRKQTFIIAIVITVLEVCKAIYNFVYGYFNPNNWVPLAYCSLFIYSAWMALSKNETIKKMGITWLVTGGIIAGSAYLIYPSTSLTEFRLFHFLSFHGLTYHALMVYTGLLYFIKGIGKAELKNYKYYAYFCTIFFIIAVILDYIFKINFMFFYDAYMLPQPLPKIQEWCLPIYTIIILLAYYIFPYLFGYILNLIKQKNYKEGDN